MKAAHSQLWITFARWISQSLMCWFTILYVCMAASFYIRLHFPAVSWTSINNFLFPDCQAVWSQRKAVHLWPQLWAPTPLIWESWTWVTITQETQEWSFWLLDWRIQTGDWKLSGTSVDSGLSSSKVSASSMLMKEFCGGKAGWNDRAIFIVTDVMPASDPEADAFLVFSNLW